MYLIIVGAGDIGTPLIDVATRSGNEVAVIERDDSRAARAADDYDCLVLHDDATIKDTLADAGAGRADAIISTTDQDATNIMVCLLAAEFDIPAILSVVHNPEHMGVFERIGVSTMENPQQLIAEYLYRAVTRPAIVDYMRIGDHAEVFEISVTDSAPVAGTTLQEAANTGALPDDVLVVAIERDGDGDPITPRGDTVIQAGDLLTVYSGVGANPSVTDAFGHNEDATG
ncbi:MULTISPECIES: potassium channel family protein [Halobacterium]|uniref:TRK potassium uptake system protein n=4 Tax=Halobacterium salinarum TaxID=2242 RepID=Q9HSL4_HALSA|nr:TrkA family potassium uptake protein [Halobacterium salinarum]AAG18790.1 TRK potassium uptake system protein [Halobacterium salinarum NRC-1]MBB6090789.1 trk system potassium uptake protein TrkA [Halobacterium salinarum]MDL0123119.1 TrkA family potassium uptake protein [Halobacterium salinarum]MDL0124541.1 TrkA family potassium uptake protein [Halobacterium salinarum]MDL0128223.1 TrkA family potassium uptake protein [Halobacterium salinarum]